MADKSRTSHKVQSGLTQPGELYVPGDALPVPEVEEKNSDSIWALWSDLVEDKPQPESKAQGETGERDFLATVPLDIHARTEYPGKSAAPQTKVPPSK
mgnify:CR=1 FL=1